HATRVLDERLDAAERLREREDARAGADLERTLLAADAERDHAAVAAHLPARDVVPGVLAQAGPQHLLDRGVLAQEPRDLLGVRAVPVHPDRERAQPAQREPRVERARDG